MDKLTVRTPAKINLGLTIGSMVAGGYHEVETVMVKIPLWDEIEYEWPDNLAATTLACDAAGVPSGRDNLLVRAYELLQRECDLPPATIKLHKNIPAGAGLGGGSLNAGGLLASVNQHLHLGLSSAQIQSLCLQVGADVAFGALDSSGVRERHHGLAQLQATPLPGLPPCQLVLVYQDFALDTTAAYAQVGALSEPRPTLDNLEQALQARSLAEICQNLHNDFLPNFQAKFPQLNNIFVQLRQAGALGAQLTGKGPTIFGIFDKDKKIELPFKFTCLSIESDQYD